MEAAPVTEPFNVPFGSNVGVMGWGTSSPEPTARLFQTVMQVFATDSRTREIGLSPVTGSGRVGDSGGGVWFDGAVVGLITRGDDRPGGSGETFALDLGDPGVRQYIRDVTGV